MAALNGSTLAPDPRPGDRVRWPLWSVDGDPQRPTWLTIASISAYVVELVPSPPGGVVVREVFDDHVRRGLAVLVRDGRAVEVAS